MKQKIEQTQQFMFAETVAGGAAYSLTLAEIAQTTRDYAGKDVFFKVNSIEVVGKRGGIPMQIKDMIGRDIISTSLENCIKVPLLNASIVSNSASKDLLIFGKDVWLFTGDFTDATYTKDLVTISKDMNLAPASEYYGRTEVRITYFAK